MYRILFLATFLLTILTARAQHWQPVSGQIPGAQFTGIAAKSSTALVATTLNSGIYRSLDSGTTWQQVHMMQDSLFSLASLDGKHLCAGGKGFSLTSSDSGATWTLHAFPFHTALGRLEFHPSGALIAGTGSKWDINAVGGKGVWLSTDTGKTWSPINTGITKPDPLIESLAISSDGSLLAGIHDGNVGLSGKFGIMKLDSLGGTWQRVSISVHAPFNQSYTDQNLRVESVFNINIIDQVVVCSITGVYINFAYGFSIQKPLTDIDNDSVFWQVKWVIDSIPVMGSFYENIVNLYKDSQDTLWASVADPGNEIFNNIYTGSLPPALPWMLTMDSISQQTGRFLFAESADNVLYSTSYFTGDEIYIRVIPGTSGLFPQHVHPGWQLFPNPATGYLSLRNENAAVGTVRLVLYDLQGKILAEKRFMGDEEIRLQLDGIAPGGLYIISVLSDSGHQMIPFEKL